MAAGFLHGGQCYPSLAEATAAKWSVQPAGITAGSTSYITGAEWSGTAWVLKRYTLSSTGALTLNTTTNAPVQNFPTCNTFERFNDGMTIGWGVAAAMVCAYALRFVADRVRS